MDHTPREQWVEAAHAKFDTFLQQLKDELPPGASIADIESVLLEHENTLMSDLFSLLVQHPELSPPGDKGNP